MTDTDAPRIDASLPPAAAGGPPLVVLRAGFGDPVSLVDAHLLETRTAEVLAALVRFARAAGSEAARVYLGERARGSRNTILQEVGKLRTTDAAFYIEVHTIALPWVSSEVTAFLRALEGRRPVPDFSPPAGGHPAETVLYLEGHPVAVTDPVALLAGEGLLAGPVFTLTGEVASPGVTEAPPGTTVRELVCERGGGVAGGKALKAVALGGPVGGFLPPSLLDVPLTDDALRLALAHVGTGTIRVIAEPACVVAEARVAMDALAEQNCGKCVCCREGTMQMAEIIGEHI